MAEAEAPGAAPAAQRLESAKWLDRKEGLNACRDGTADVSGAQLAKLLLGEANASVVDACATAASNAKTAVSARGAFGREPPKTRVRKTPHRGSAASSRASFKAR
jgi:hypothetical protein